MRQVIKSAYSYCDLNVDEWVEPEEESQQHSPPQHSSPQSSSPQCCPELSFSPIQQPILSPLPKNTS